MRNPKHVVINGIRVEGPAKTVITKVQRKFWQRAYFTALKVFLRNDSISFEESVQGAIDVADRSLREAYPGVRFEVLSQTQAKKGLTPMGPGAR